MAFLPFEKKKKKKKKISMAVGVVKHAHEYAYENTYCTNDRPGMAWQLAIVHERSSAFAGS